MRWSAAAALVLALLIPVWVGGHEFDIGREHVWGVGTLQGATTPSGRFSGLVYTATAAHSSASSINTWVPFTASGTAWAEQAYGDPTGDFAWDDTCDGYLYSGPDSTFLVTGEITTIGGGNGNSTIGIGTDSVDPDTSDIYSRTVGVSLFSVQNQPVTGILDVGSGDCVGFWERCSTADCDMTMVLGSTLSIVEVQPSGAVIQGTHSVSTAASYDYTVSAAEVENGVIYATTCPVGPCNINLPAMSAGKSITIITDDSAGSFVVNPDSSDQIVPLTDGVGDAVSSSGNTEGEEITILSLDGTNLQGTIKYGSWIDATP